MTKRRIVIIPFLDGKITAAGRLVEPDIHDILDKWLVRHAEYRGLEKELRKDDIRQCTRDLLLVERAREWLLGD